MLGALQNYLDAIAFLSHGSMQLFGGKTVGTSVCQNGIDALLIHRFQRGCRETQGYPLVFRRYVKTLAEQVHVELALILLVRERYVVASHGFLSRQFTHS